MSGGVGNDDDRSPVERLAEEYLERRGNGDRVTVDDYASEYPHLAEDIREVFPALEALQSLSHAWKRTVVGPQLAGPPLPFQLGDYRLERRIGSGGMGIVYEAEHTSLRRRVALKILRMSSPDSAKDIKRFHNEAQAAARLHHSNIVPVFDFGEAEGFHFIAMQLIQGNGMDLVVEQLRQQRILPAREQRRKAPPRRDSRLDDTLISDTPLDDTSTSDVTRPGSLWTDAVPEPDRIQTSLIYGSPNYWRDIAEIGIQAARGLDYAHSHGTLHRDVKPANLLLDEEGVTWVADFGLARQDDAALATQSGTLSGTLRYFAPEQFHGRSDRRTDQYGLGLSLYELATLESVVGDTRGHAEIMRRITEAKIVPPRQRNARIPRDLETIILKSIAPDPANRFATCHDLAEDLQRFVDGHPIHSRPVTRIERLWRWAKRYPALAATTGSSAILLLLVAVVATLGYRAESEQRKRAVATSAYAQEALDTVFDNFAVGNSAELLNGTAMSTPVLSQESAQMLEGLLPIFDRLAELDDQSPDVLHRATLARKRVGDIQQRLGQFEAAIASYRQAADRFEKADDNTPLENALKRSDVFNSIGTCELMLGRIEASRTSHQIALERLQPFASAASAEVRYQLARTHFLMARRLRPGESPNDGELVGPAALQGDRQDLELAIALLESLSDEQRREPRCRHLLAMCLKGLATDQLSGRSDNESSAEARALAILEQLAAEFPKVPEYHHAYVSVLATIDTQHPDAIVVRDLPVAEERLRLAIKGGTDLVARHPYVPDYTQTLIHAHNRLAHVLERRADLAPEPDAENIRNHALEAYQSAAMLQSELAQRFPEATAYKVWQQEFERSARRVSAQIGKS